MHHHKKPKQPLLEDEFSHVTQFWDAKNTSWAVKILPGEFFISKNGGEIAAVLGSCIAACIRDTVLGIGGMNHFMLPEPQEKSTDVWGGNPTTHESRYGNWAMEYLINGIIKRGGRKENLEVKLFGGGQMIASMSDIGQRNIIFAYNYLNSEGLNIASSDVGDVYARKVLYFPDTGKVKLKRINNSSNSPLIQRDTNYNKQVSTDSSTSSAGSIDLF